MQRTPIVRLTVCIDADADECLYIDGKAWESTGETTVYACDIAEAAGNKLVRFEHTHIDTYVEKWPDTLLEAMNLNFPQTEAPE